MPLESPTYLQDLVVANPLSTDDAKQGDDHIRAIKTALDNTFPDADRAVYFGNTIAASTSNVSVSFPGDGSKVFPIDATAGAKIVTLPSPSGVGGRKWSIRVVKEDSSANTVTISGAEDINGEDDFVLSMKGQAVDIMWDTVISAWRAFPTVASDLLPLLIGSTQVLGISQGGSGQDTAQEAYDAWHVNGSDIASAATINLTTATGSMVDVTGTTTITAITLAEGKERWVRAAGAFQINHGANLVLPGQANIVAGVGDIMCFRGYAAGLVRCLHYQRLSGIPVLLYAPARAYAELATYTGRTGSIPFDDSPPVDTDGDQILTLDIAMKRIESRLLLEFNCWCALTENATETVTAAIFSELSSSALNVVAIAADIDAPNTGVKYHFHVRAEFAPNTLDTITCQARMGTTGSTTYYVNGNDDGRLYGGASKATLRATEIFL